MSTAGERLAQRIELRWAIAMGGLIVFLLAVVVFTALHWASMPPSRVEIIDPTTLHLQGEFTEDNLGTAIDEQGHVTVRVLAEQYTFRPHCLVVPVGQPVTFRATSSDVIHGFQIGGTNINSMLVPGYVSTFIATLHDTSPHLMPCHEFCGMGHATMWASVQALPSEAFYKLAQGKRRITCG